MGVGFAIGFCGVFGSLSCLGNGDTNIIDCSIELMTNFMLFTCSIQ